VGVIVLRALDDSRVNVTSDAVLAPAATIGVLAP
jgi:hypothetical protein